MPRHKSPWRDITVRQLRARRAQLVRQLPDVQATLYGALQHQMRKCGQPGCGCATGTPHGPYTYFSGRDGPQQRLLYVPAAEAATVTRHVALTHQLETTLADISAINLELLARGVLD
jgi:hypothetical protein